MNDLMLIITYRETGSGEKKNIAFVGDKKETFIETLRKTSFYVVGNNLDYVWDGMFEYGRAEIGGSFELRLVKNLVEIIDLNVRGNNAEAL